MQGLACAIEYVTLIEHNNWANSVCSTRQKRFPTICCLQRSGTLTRGNAFQTLQLTSCSFATNKKQQTI